jgi:putative ATP-dependent endonuclease of OLD family
LLSDKKTIYPSILSQKIFESEKPIPPKLIELFSKIIDILNPVEDEQN